MKKHNDKNANTSPGEDMMKATADPRLKSVVTLIETQLSPVKEVLADFAKAMLDNTITLENRIKSFEKYSPPTMEDTPNEPQEPNELSFIPRSARVKLELNHSKALANDTEIIRLKRDLELCKKEFTEKVTKVFKTCAELELNYCKQERITTFLSYALKITKALIVFERIETPLVTQLNSIQFSVRTLITCLRKIRLTVTPPGELNFFREYLKMDEPDVREALIKNFIPPEQPFREMERNENELDFQDVISDKLINLILPITAKLQANINKENKIKKAASLLAAEFKRTEILNATQATAIAVGNTSTTNVTMEQHIKNLVEEAVKKQTSNNSTIKQKNSPGSKKPRPSLPKNTSKGNTTRPQQNENRKRKTPEPNSSTDPQKEPESSNPKKTKRNRPNEKNKQENIKHKKNNRGKNKRKNAQGPQGEKQKGKRKENGKNQRK